MVQALLCIAINSIKYQLFVYTQLNDQTALYLTIQFNINHLFAHCLNVSSIWTIDGTQSGATTPDQSEPRSNGIEGVIRIPQISRPEEGLVSYPENSLGGYPFAKMQSVYSTATADWV